MFHEASRWVYHFLTESLGLQVITAIPVEHAHCLSSNSGSAWWGCHVQVALILSDRKQDLVACGFWLPTGLQDCKVRKIPIEERFVRPKKSANNERVLRRGFGHLNSVVHLDSFRFVHVYESGCRKWFSSFLRACLSVKLNEEDLTYRLFSQAIVCRDKLLFSIDKTLNYCWK